MDNKSYRILLVDDEPDILEFLSYNLTKEGFNVRTCSNGKDAIILASQTLPHLILLDVMMPEMDGIETCEELRKISSLKDCIIAFLTARGEDYSQIAGFDAGADDYITKPVRPKVLVSRLNALLKRADKNIIQEKNQTSHTISGSDLIIDKNGYSITSEGKEILLPRKEFELLLLLSSKPGKVFTREEILYSIWGKDIIVGDRTIDVHIKKIREKIGDKYIVTIKGVGYRFKD